MWGGNDGLVVVVVAIFVMNLFLPSEVPFVWANHANYRVSVRTFVCCPLPRSNFRRAKIRNVSRTDPCALAT